MAEYIEREAVLEAAKKSHLYFDIKPIINSIPAADVRPVVRGKWVDNKVAFYLGCSECGCYLEYAVDTFLDYGDHYNFCPNCGADMRAEEGE